MTRHRKPRTQPKPDARVGAAPAVLPPVAGAPVTDAGDPGTIGRWVVPLLLVGATLAAYFNSFAGVFQLDDLRTIANDPRIRELWPPWGVLSGTSRPVSRFSLAVNYAAGGLQPWGYHAFNLAVHVVAGLILYGIVRRTLGGQRLRGRFGHAAPWLAGAVAAIWLVHPLQTESVTYIVQRDESLMGMFFLLTLYCGIRACTSARPRRWGVATVVACALGMGTKEVMVSAPILVLFYDVLFVAGSVREALRLRWRLHVSLAATWAILAGLLLELGQQWVTSLGGESEQISAWDYASTQPAVIVHYLRLALWPQPLVFDYKWPVAATPGEVVPYAVALVALLGGALVSLRRWPWLGFLGVWFFAVLAPTSSVVPLADMAFEHRMYLPLAAVVVLVVIGGHQLAAYCGPRIGLAVNARGWLETGLLVAVVVALGVATARRNEDYRSAYALWSDTVAKRPDNPRARNNLGGALSDLGNVDAAITEFNAALRLRPNDPIAHKNMAAMMIRQGRLDEAVAHAREAIRVAPRYADAHNDLAAALIRQGRLDEAMPHLSTAIQLRPDHANARYNLGIVLDRKGRLDDAVAQYFEAVRLNPGYGEAHASLALALTRQGKVDAAKAQYAEAMRLKPDSAAVRNSLGRTLAAAGNLDGAIAQYNEALRLDPNDAQAEDNLGSAYFRQGKTKEAIAHYSRAVALNPADATAHNNLGAALGTDGRSEEASRHFAEALRLDPNDKAARDNLRAAQASLQPRAKK